MSEAPLTSEDIFLQYCQAKPDKATEFINDYILYCLDKSKKLYTIIVPYYHRVIELVKRLNKL